MAYHDARRDSGAYLDSGHARPQHASKPPQATSQSRSLSNNAPSPGHPSMQPGMQPQDQHYTHPHAHGQNLRPSPGHYAPPPLHLHQRRASDTAQSRAQQQQQHPHQQYPQHPSLGRSYSHPSQMHSSAAHSPTHPTHPGAHAHAGHPHNPQHPHGPGSTSPLPYYDSNNYEYPLFPYGYGITQFSPTQSVGLALGAPGGHVSPPPPPAASGEGGSGGSGAGSGSGSSTGAHAGPRTHAQGQNQPQNSTRQAPSHGQGQGQGQGPLNMLSHTSHSQSQSQQQDAFSSFFSAPSDSTPPSIPALPENMEASIMSGSSWVGYPLLDLGGGSTSTNTGGDTRFDASPPTANNPNPSNSSQPQSAPANSLNHNLTPPLQTPLSAQSAPAQLGNGPGGGTAPTQSVSAGISVPADQDLLGRDLGGWSLAVDPLPFSSGLEGISFLPLDVYHATTAVGAMPPMPQASGERATEWAPAFDDEVKLLDTYLEELISLMEPFAPSPTNDAPPAPPPYLHTRLSRLATLVRETLASLEGRSQPSLSSEFSRLAPGDADLAEAEREMELIRRRRDVLIAKAAQGKRDATASTARQGQAHQAQVLRPPPRDGLPYATAPDPMRPGRQRQELWRCHGCGATQSTEWKDGPDGPQSLCETCGYHYERLVRKRSDGHGDFSTVPAPGYDPSMIGLGP